MSEAEVEDGAMVDVLRSLDVLDDNLDIVDSENVQLDVNDGEDVVDGTITYGTILIVKTVKIAN